MFRNAQALLTMSNVGRIALIKAASAQKELVHVKCCDSEAPKPIVLSFPCSEAVFTMRPGCAGELYMCCARHQCSIQQACSNTRRCTALRLTV